MANEKFTRQWKDSKTDPPAEMGRYWCNVSEQNDLGKSNYQWNCFWHSEFKYWSNDEEVVNVTHWTELAPHPVGT